MNRIMLVSGPLAKGFSPRSGTRACIAVDQTILERSSGLALFAEGAVSAGLQYIIEGQSRAIKGKGHGVLVGVRIQDLCHDIRHNPFSGEAG